MSELEKTCGNCKYRGKDLIEKTGYINNPNMADNIKECYFTCELIKHKASGLNYIWNEKPSKDDPDGLHLGDIPTEPAFTYDGSDYHSALCVSSDFGCNQWEAKD